MKAKEIKKLIGHEITWFTHIDPWRGSGIVHRGWVIQVVGRNVLIDQYGWQWLPDMKFISEYKRGL